MTLGASTDEHFLQQNRDEIFKALVQSEGHLRKLGGERKPGFGSCVMKHLAEAEGEAEEAVSHALTVEGVEASERFKEFATRVRALKKRFQNQDIEPHEGLAEVKELRAEFVKLSPSHDTSNCTKCEDAERQFREINEILEGDEGGEPFLISKGDTTLRSSGMKATTKEVLGVYGASNIAKGLERAFVELDRMTGRDALPLAQRPSVWVNLGLAVALPMAVAFDKLKAPYDLLALVVGGHLSTKVWDYAEAVSTGGASLSYVPSAAAPKTSYKLTG